MSGIKVVLRSEPDQRLDLSHVTSRIAVNELERLAIGTSRTPVYVADVFAVSGSPGDALTIEGGSDRLDFIGAKNAGATIVVDGDVGAYAGRQMASGSLEIRGNAGAFLASSLAGGNVTVLGSAGDSLGAPAAGDRFGISGGTIVVQGNVGARAGERMRRGAILSAGRIETLAGTRMMGGTIWAEGGLGDRPGHMMRRGTLIAPSCTRIAETFADCGNHDLGIVTIISRYLAGELGPLAPRKLVGPVRRFAGDLASLGRGELLLYA